MQPREVGRVSRTLYIALAGLELTIFLHPKCWNYSSALGLHSYWRATDLHGALRNSTFSVVMSREPMGGELGWMKTQLNATHG